MPEALGGAWASAPHGLPVAGQERPRAQSLRRGSGPGIKRAPRLAQCSAIAVLKVLMIFTLR